MTLPIINSNTDVLQNALEVITDYMNHPFNTELYAENVTQVIEHMQDIDLHSFLTEDEQIEVAKMYMNNQAN